MLCLAMMKTDGVLFSQQSKHQTVRKTRAQIIKLKMNPNSCFRK